MNTTLKRTLIVGALLSTAALAPKAQAQTVITYFNFSNAAASTAGTAVPVTQGVSSTGFFSNLANTVPAGTNSVGSYIITDTTTSATNGQAFSIIPGTTSTAYVEFSTLLTGVTDPGLILSYATQRSTTGAVTQTITYSADSTFATGVATLGTFTVPTSFGLASFSLSGLGLDATTTPEYFRITSSGGTGTSGTNRYDNVFVGVPAVAAAPEPSGTASILVGAAIMGGLLCVARRRTSAQSQAA